MCLISASATRNPRTLRLIKSESNTQGQDGETNHPAVKSRTVKREVAHLRLKSEGKKREEGEDEGEGEHSDGEGGSG